MLKKIIQILLIVILVMIIALAIALIFNPFNSRTKLIGGIINSYLSSTIEGYTPLKENSNEPKAAENNGQNEPAGIAPESKTVADKNPLLNESQEKTLESFGVNVEQLPTAITPGMEACFIEILGKERVDEIVRGDTPSALEFFKARNCLGK